MTYDLWYLCSFTKRLTVSSCRQTYVPLTYDLWSLFSVFLHTEADRPIMQADAVLLTYPLNWNMSADIMKNDLLFYEMMLSPRTPATTWSFFTVGFKWVQEEARMQNYFLKSYQDYLIQPFKVRRVQNIKVIMKGRFAALIRVDCKWEHASVGDNGCLIKRHGW